MTDTEDHEHIWGEVELAHFTGNPHRKCTVGYCNHVTLDLHDDEFTEWTVRYAARNANGIAWIGDVTVGACEDTVEECAEDEIRSHPGPAITTLILVDFTRHPPKKAKGKRKKVKQ